MTLDDQATLEFIRLRAENAALRSEVDRLKCELQELQSMGSDAIWRDDAQLVLFE